MLCLQKLTIFSLIFSEACFIDESTLKGRRGNETKSREKSGSFCGQMTCAIVSDGEMSEWLKELAWKACKRENVSWVRIPLPPLIIVNKR